MRQTRYRSVGGVLLALAGATILMGIITAEALYPAAYRTDQNTISDLGGTRPPDSVVLQPSAAIFDATMVLTGLAIIAAAFLFYQALGRRAVAISTGLLGLGVLGVGIFPGNTEPHQLFAMLTFIAGGIAAIASARAVSSPLRYVFAGSGAVALAALAAGLFLLDWNPIAELGEGGIERWVAYPVVLWMVGFGSHVAALAPRPADHGGGSERDAAELASPPGR
jgi:hypothetical membrane protein